MILGPQEDPIELLKRGLDKDFKGFYDLVILNSQPLKVLIVSSSVDPQSAKQLATDMETRMGSPLEYTVVAPEVYKGMQKMGVLR